MGPFIVQTTSNKTVWTNALAESYTYVFLCTAALVTLLVNGTMRLGRRLDVAVAQIPRQVACSAPGDKEKAQAYAQRLLSGWARLGVQPIWATAPPSSLLPWRSARECNAIGRAAAFKAGAPVLDLAAQTMGLLEANLRRVGYGYQKRETRIWRHARLASPKGGGRSWAHAERRCRAMAGAPLDC